MSAADAVIEAVVTAGTLVGRRVGDGSVLRFGGVPYAAPPVGQRRFAAPAPIEPWTGVRDCGEAGPAPPQVAGDAEPVPDMAVGATSEDCLTAQIWTPSLEGRRPVLVWIPGGRYQSGGASLATYDGARLAAEGNLVVVGLNYRLGALGFLFAPTEAVPANLGLRDLLAALRWLRAEATAFGGDPERIVVMGESAGAGAIAHLLAIAETETLIAGAILQSGAPAATLDPATATLVGETVMAAAGVSSDDRLDELRALPVDAIVAAQAEADAELLATVGMMPLHPVVDGELLTAAPMDASRAGTLAAVPLVVGTTAEEMELFRAAVPRLPEEYAIGFLARKLTPVLGRTPTDAAVARGLAAVGGDLVEAIADADLHLPASLLTDAHAARGLPVWRYRFSWRAPEVGAAHAVDLPFTFGTLDVDRWREFVGATEPADRAAADLLSTRMRAAWASFCHDLAPACEPIGAWPRHAADRRATVRLDRTVGVVQDLDVADATRFRAWTEP